MYKPKKLEYHYTSHLSSMLKMVSQQKYIDTHEQIDFYASEYENSLNLYDGPTVAHNFNLAIQDFINKLLNIEDSKKVSCKKGCSACCSLHIDISDHEAQLLIQHATEENIDINWSKIKRQSGLDIDGWSRLSKTDQQCVFLDADQGVCKVYEYRPASCRKAMVITDPELCNTITHPKQQVGWAVNGSAEILASAIFNATKSGSMPDMLLENKNFKNAQ